MIPLSQPTKIVESAQSRGVFVIEGLYPGYGFTIGNSLRRVLLSSLEGAAVTQAKMKGVQHEFSTLPGVLEDSIVILLNLKQLRFRLHGEEPQTAVLKIKGEKEVTASDFKLPAALELINEDFVIAHTTDKAAELEIEIKVEKGVGYVPAEERKQEKQEIGTIALDSIFTPIKRVRSNVENMRVGDRTDFNRLTLEIETDGTLTAQEALYYAVDLLMKQFDVVMSGIRFSSGSGEESTKSASAQKESKKKVGAAKKSSEKKQKKTATKEKKVSKSKA